MIEYLVSAVVYFGVGVLLVWRDRYLRDVSIAHWLQYSLSIVFSLVAGLYIQVAYGSFIFGVIASLIAACCGILIAELLHKLFPR